MDAAPADAVGNHRLIRINAMAESAIGRHKTELPRKPDGLAGIGAPWPGLDELDIAICAWVAWDNEERIHGELEDRTPTEVEAANQGISPGAQAA